MTHNGSPSKNYRFLKVINIREANKGFYCLRCLTERSSWKNNCPKKRPYNTFDKGYFGKKWRPKLPQELFEQGFIHQVYDAAQVVGAEH